MKREIKFRAFVKHEKLQLMLELVSVLSASNSIGVYHEQVYESLESTDWVLNDDYEFENKVTGERVPHDEMKMYDTGEDSFVIHDAMVMQFTGLLDKNGKEIYEGDIVELEFVGGQIESGVISYFEESAGFKWTSTDPSDKDNYWLNQSDYTLRKVIGNIYGNPELLK